MTPAQQLDALIGLFYLVLGIVVFACLCFATAEAYGNWEEKDADREGVRRAPLRSGHSGRAKQPVASAARFRDSHIPPRGDNPSR